jgi:hypothetical protein
MRHNETFNNLLLHTEKNFLEISRTLYIYIYIYIYMSNVGTVLNELGIQTQRTRTVSTAKCCAI